MKHKWWIIIGASIALYFGLALVRYTRVPACINADEASFGYSAYSILKTGRDEYGTFLPLRLRSFGDFKLPLYSYASIPSIAIFGLKDYSVRLPNILWGALLLTGIGLLSQLVFKRAGISILSSLIAMSSVWTLLLIRQAHEGVLCTALIVWAAVCFVYYTSNKQIRYVFLSIFLLLLSTFAYHYGRLFLIVLGGWMIADLVRQYLTEKIRVKNLFALIAYFLIAVSIPFAVDLHFGADRVTSLTFLSYPGFTQRINDLRGRDNNRLLYNKVTVGGFVFIEKYLAHFSPQFLLTHGDANTRFGYPGMNSIAITTYMFFFIGLYFFVRRKDRRDIVIWLLLLASPVASSLTWQDASLNRAYPLIVPLSMLAALGLVQTYSFIQQRVKSNVMKRGALAFGFFSVVIATILPLRVYFTSYPRDPRVIRWWQCGYKELVHDLNAHPTKHTFITRKHGQPYIYFLFYNRVDPNYFLETARFTKPDEYGFIQVERFGKYVFELPTHKNDTNSTYVGYPDEIQNEKARTISFGAQPIFSILQRPTNTK